MTRAQTQTAKSQAEITPERALEMLRNGNRRFVNDELAERDLHEQVEITSHGQHPFAIVLGCIDSRVPPEIIFDQGIGDVFTTRVAGNVVSPDVLGSMEFACRMAHSRLVVVLGHTMCGAVAGVLQGAELGKLTTLLDKIGPATKVLVEDDRLPENLTPQIIERVAESNVVRMVARIREESPVLAEMEAAGEIAVVGAMYHVESGEVVFLESD